MTNVEMWKCGNNLLWHLNPRKKLWQFQIGSFTWVCWLGPKPFVLSHIATNHVPGGCCATSEQRWGACCAPSQAQLCQGRVQRPQWQWWARPKHPLPWGSAVHLAWDGCLGPSRPWERCSGSVQQTQKLMIGLKNFKTKYFYLFLLLSPHHMHKPPKVDIFPHTFFTLLSWKVPYSTFVQQPRQQGACAGGGGEGARQDPWQSLHGPSLALLAGTDWGDANALPPPSSLRGEKWMILCQGHPATPGREQQAGPSPPSGYSTVSPCSMPSTSVVIL